MNNDKNNSPDFYIKNNHLFTDRCIWCGEKGKMSKSHLFPESIGGGFEPKVSCSACNNFLGHAYEKETKRNAFITAAMVKLGLTNKKEGFRYAKKHDTETGAEMHITKKGQAKPIKKVIDGNKFIGSLHEIKKYRIDKFRKQYPNWPTKPLEEFFDDPTRRNFTYVGVKYTKKIYDAMPTEIKLSGLNRDPSPKLIFKIIYEFLALNRLLSHSGLSPIIKSIVKINKMNGERIIFADEINDRYLSNTVKSFKEYRQLEDIEFKKHHFIIIRLSSNLNLYVEVMFFGQLRSFFILGYLNKYDERILPLIDNVYIFPIGDSESYMEKHPNLLQPEHTKLANDAVDIRFNVIKDILKYSNI